jgi:hypothetical protein
MIVKIELEFKEKEQLIMLFGNSYKKWDEQFSEYCRMHKPISILSAYSSTEDWIGWGGLKWCVPEKFQAELNREGCQSKDPDNPNPRKYEYMRFGPNKIVENIANKIARR